MTPGAINTPPLALLLRAYCFRFGYAVNPLSLATHVYSQARFSKRTLRPYWPLLLQQPFDCFIRRGAIAQAVTDHSHLISSSFYLSPEILFSLPSQYIVRYRFPLVFRVGSWCLPNSPRISNPSYSESNPFPSGLSLRGYHPL